MQLIRRLHIPALVCALLVLVCALISRPFTTIGICDDGAYILMAKHLATTGHIVYNGWGAAMMAMQLYLGAAFIKLFGFSFTTVRASALLIAVVTAFILQRTLVRTGITERNATLGTLALVLSPLYLLLSVTFMTDITGLFAVVLCLYGCLRALQAATDRATIAWLGFAVAANVLCGTSRQVAWLGTLVMVPSTLWLLRAQRRGLPSERRVLLAGAAATSIGILSILGCMHWLKHQPYVIPVPLYISNFPVEYALTELGHLLLDLPFLLLPIFALFLPEIRRSRPRVIAILSTLLLGLLFLALYPSSIRGHFSHLLEPTADGPGSWVGTLGPDGTVILHPGVQVLLTVVAYGGLIGLVLSLLYTTGKLHTAGKSRDTGTARHTGSFNQITWKQLGILLAPFSLVYALLLLSAAATTDHVFDRYALELLLAALPCLVRYYQERIQLQLPLMSLVLILLAAGYGVILTHNRFAYDRAHVALNAELAAHGVPDTSVDNGWEYNFDVELRHADHINHPLLKTPANGYTSVPPPSGICKMSWYDRTPHIHALYGVFVTPDACYGPAPFAPVHYSRWLYRTPGTLYVVRYTPAPKP
jgi:hypothetical protein